MIHAEPDERAGRRVGQPVSFAGGQLTLQLLPRAPYSARDPAHLASIGVALERQTGVHAIGSDRREAFDRWPGTLSLTPAGVDVFSESLAGGEYLVLRCSTELDVAREWAHHPTRVCTGGARTAFYLAREIRRALLGPTLDSVLVEGLAWQLMMLGAAPPPVPARGNADGARDRYAAVLARIADAFDQPLTLDELAALTDESPLSFLRGFTAAVGMTPHAYLTEHRLQAARSLVADMGRPLSEVALACGFSHQSHFGNAFKRAFGLTPAHYRRLADGAAPTACQRK